MNIENIRQIEFGRLDKGSKFYLARPLPEADEKLSYIKIDSQKSSDGKWSNAKNIYGLTMFVQYDKRVWSKTK